MRLAIASGGTGGHLYPAIAVGREFLSRDSLNKLIFLGSMRGLESRLIPQEGFELISYDVGYIRGKSIVGKVSIIYKLFKAIVKARRDLKKWKADALLGFGGYASATGSIAAISIGIPFYMAEQNRRLGLTNSVLGRFAKKVFLSWDDTDHNFSLGKVLITGNPVRSEFYDDYIQDKGSENGKLNLLVIGGSQGAMTINEGIASSIDYLNLKKDKIRLVHQTGERGYEKMFEEYKRAEFEYELTPFIKDMANKMKRADLVFSRAGASSMTEISASGKAAVYIPYRYAAYNHQLENARLSESKNAAFVILDEDFNLSRISKLLDKVIDERSLLFQMGQNARSISHSDSAKLIVDNIVKGK